MGMSALGHKRTFLSVRPMSALPPKADIAPGMLPNEFSYTARASVLGGYRAQIGHDGIEIVHRD
jgi:hypothetical protein